jgi:hypothetical protein
LAYLDGKQQHPAILELPHYCFAAFDQLLKEIGAIEKLPTVRVGIKPVDTPSGRTELEFRLLD